MSGMFRSYDEARNAIAWDKEPTPQELAAITTIAERCEIFKTEGWRVETWTPPEGCPGARELDHHWEYAVFGELAYSINSWFDHPYKLLPPSGGDPIYVSEPYHLDKDGLQCLLILADLGWQVAIRPEMAIWYPGRTVAIWIRRQGKV